MISKRYENNPSVKRANSQARAAEYAVFARDDKTIRANAGRIDFISRELSRHELDRIARFESYVRAHTQDILTPSAPVPTTDGPSMDHAARLSAPIFECELCANVATKQTRYAGMLTRVCDNCYTQARAHRL